jgi:hypothetical protein
VVRKSFTDQSAEFTFNLLIYGGYDAFISLTGDIEGRTKVAKRQGTGVVCQVV